MARALTERGIAVMVSLDGIGAAHDAQRPTLTGKYRTIYPEAVRLEGLRLVKHAQPALADG